MNTRYSMATRARFSRYAALGLVAGFLGLPQALPAADPAKTAPPAGSNAPAATTNAPAAEVVIAKSEYNDKLPQGRDPFFPNSTRGMPVAASKPATVAGVVQKVQKPAFDYSQFVLKGISGPVTRRLAIINDRTFAVGEEQEVSTRTGKMHIHCQEIRGSSVLISFGNPPQPLELRMPVGY